MGASKALAAFIVALTAAQGRAQGAPEAPRYHTVRVEWANDIFFRSDNLFTDGFDIQWHSRGWGDWSGGETGERPYLLARAGGLVPGLRGEGMAHRHAFTIGQHMQTPADLSATALIPEDVAYAGALVGINSWYVYDDRRFRGFEFLVGVLGPGSWAQETQRFVHRATGSKIPLGWDNQAPSRALVGAGYTLKQKLFGLEAFGWGLDGTVDGQGYLANMYSLAGARAQLRLGYNLPRGFLYTPGKLGATMIYDATFPPPRVRHPSVYVSLQGSLNRVFYNVFVDDNGLADKLTARKEPWIGRAALGLHYRHGFLAIHMTFVETTGQVKAGTTTDPENSDRYGDLSLEFRF